MSEYENSVTKALQEEGIITRDYATYYVGKIGEKDIDAYLGVDEVWEFVCKFLWSQCCSMGSAKPLKTLLELPVWKMAHAYCHNKRGSRQVGEMIEYIQSSLEEKNV